MKGLTKSGSSAGFDVATGSTNTILASVLPTFSTCLAMSMHAITIADPDCIGQGYEGHNCLGHNYRDGLRTDMILADMGPIATAAKRLTTIIIIIDNNIILIII